MRGTTQFEDIPLTTYLKCLIVSVFSAYYAIAMSPESDPTIVHDTAHGRDVIALLVEMKQELQDFVQTRLTLLRAELQQKLKIVKTSAPMAVAGVVLLLTAYLLLTLAAVALVFAFLPDNPYRWCLAFVAIAVLWSLFLFGLLPLFDAVHAVPIVVAIVLVGLLVSAFWVRARVTPSGPDRSSVPASR